MNIKLIIALLCISSILTSKSNRDLIERYKFFTEIDQFTNSSVKIGLSKENGLFCVANRDISLGENVFKVPKRNSLCPHFNFPFKFEIFESLYSIPQLKESIGKEQNIGVYLLTYFVLYIKHANKKAIKDYIENQNLTDYKSTHDFNENIPKSFPELIIGSSTLDPEEFANLRELGLPVQKEYELEFVWKNVISSISQKSIHSEMIYPWISSFEDFKSAYGAALSRGLTVRLNEYKNLEDIPNRKLTDAERKNEEVNSIFAKNVGAPCIVTYIDMCNHYQPKHLDMRDKRPIILDTVKGYFVNQASTSYSTGEEISITYSNEPSNFVLFVNYGFIIPRNIFNNYRLRIEEDAKFSINQFNVCRELGCLDSTIKDPLKIPRSRFYVAKYGVVMNDLINYARVKYLSSDFNSNKVLRALRNDKTISYENEVKSWAYYAKAIQFNQFTGLELDKSIHSVQRFRNLRKKNENEGKLDSESVKLWRKYKHNELIFETDISYRMVLVEHKNRGLGNLIKNIKESTNDLKFKKYIK